MYAINTERKKELLSEAECLAEGTGRTTEGIVDAMDQSEQIDIKATLQEELVQKEQEEAERERGKCSLRSDKTNTARHSHGTI